MRIPAGRRIAIAAAEDEAQQLTGVRVSVLTPGFLPPKFRDRVLQQAEPL